MTYFEIIKPQFLKYKEYLSFAKECDGLSLADFCNPRPPAKVENFIGHVYVKGCLLRDASIMEKKCGNTDYRDIQEDLETVIENGAKAIVLHVDSGGGMVNGAIEAAKAVSGASVPVVAYIEGTGASAAYKLSCGATWVVSSESAEVGSIGAIIVYQDESKLFESMGISFTAFCNDGADLKSTGHLPSLTEIQAEFLQSSINECGELFKAHVLANRPNINPEVFKAGWFSGQHALSLGLIDEIGGEDLAILRATQLADTFDKNITNTQND